MKERKKERKLESFSKLNRETIINRFSTSFLKGGAALPGIPCAGIIVIGDR